MSHYPIGSWNGQGRGSVHVHGHCHGSYQNTKGRMLDVGWDNVGKLLTLDEVVANLTSIEIETTDQHKIIV